MALCGKFLAHPMSAFLNKAGHFAVPKVWHVACIGNRMLSGVTSNLEHYMDLLSARQKLAVSNIANADTPGYRTKDIDFQSEFRGALQGSPPTVIEVQGLAVHNDGNNVSIDRGARNLAANASHC